MTKGTVKMSISLPRRVVDTLDARKSGKGYSRIIASCLERLFTLEQALNLKEK